MTVSKSTVRTRKIGEENPPDNQEIVNDVLGDDQAPIDGIAELLGSLGDGGGFDVSVSRMDGRKMEWLFDFEPDQLSAKELRAQLRDEYGGGDYKVVVRKPGGIFVGHRVVSIFGGKAAKKFGGGAQDISPGGDRLADVLLAIQQSNQQQMQSLQTMIAAGRQESMEQQIKMMQLMLESGNKKASGDMDVIGLLTVAKELFKGKDDSVNILLKGMELGRQSVPEKDENESGGLGKVLEKFGAPLVGLLTEHKRSQMAGAGSEVVPGAENQVQELSQDEIEQMNIIQQTQIRMAASMFIKAAANGSSVETYAQMFCEQYGDQVPDAFITEVEEFNKIFTVVPEAEQYRDWFEQLRVKCVEILFESTEQEEN